MHLQLSAKEYVARCQARSNHLLSLENMLEPFCIGPPKGARSSFLFLGHLLEQLQSLNSPDDYIDPLDVATLALELGFDQAESFLRDGPELMVRMLMAESPSE